MEFVASQELSDYEYERGKPMPSKLHSVLTQRLLHFFLLHCKDRFEALPELTLDTPGDKTTPGIALCEIEPIDFSKDETKRKDPPFVTIEILSPTQVLQTLIDKTNVYFSFGVKSCWIVLPTLKSIYVFSAPHQFKVYSIGEEVFDPNFNIRIPMDTLFAA